MSLEKVNEKPADQLRFIPLTYNNADSHTSALRLVLSLLPDWEFGEGKIEFIRFTDGITNTLLKAVKRRPGYTEEQIDKEAVLMRAYGRGTEVLIDRDRECTSHSLLSKNNLAPPLLARFQNGLLYRFIRGRACEAHDLTTEPVWRGVAQRLGQWHAVLPIISVVDSCPTKIDGDDMAFTLSNLRIQPSLADINAITPNMSTPNLWTVIQKWIFALPVNTEAEKTRQGVLQKELERTVDELGNTRGLGKDGLIFGHCDLLSGNVIIHPPSLTSCPNNKAETVSFIDYEYATPSPAAFDLANHFAEWGGLECDYSALPTRSTRRAFLREYLASYRAHLPESESTAAEEDLEDQVERLFAEVDLFRGIPGFYWGIWALIQATISQIDFDYAKYAEVRLGEYWDWRKAEGRAVGKGEREERWGSE